MRAPKLVVFLVLWANVGLAQMVVKRRPIVLSGPATTTTSTVTTTSGSTTTVPGGVAPSDWGSSFVAWWPLDSVTGGSSPQGGGSCGSSCNLATLLNTPTIDSTNFRQGTGSLATVRASSQAACCNESTTCTALNVASGPVTWGCWIRPTVVNVNQSFLRNRAGTGAGLVASLGTTGLLTCLACNSSGCTNASSSTALTAGAYAHAVCRYDGSVVNTVLDGVPGTAGSSHAIGASAQTNFCVSTDVGGNIFGGDTDECFVATSSIANASLCRMRACGIDGSHCWCNGTNAALYRVCTSDIDCNNRAGACDVSGTGRCTGRLSTGPVGCQTTNDIANCDAATP